jgi:hypothetical protein
MSGVDLHSRHFINLRVLDLAFPFLFLLIMHYDNGQYPLGGVGIAAARGITSAWFTVADLHILLFLSFWAGWFVFLHRIAGIGNRVIALDMAGWHKWEMANSCT